MFLFIYATLLPALIAASSTKFAYDIACSLDDSNGLPISLNNGLEYQVNVTISCSNDDFFYSLEPNDVVVLPAFLNEWTNQGKIYPNDSCVLNEIDGRSQGYSIRAESADSVINGTQSCNYSVGDYPVVNHTTDCKENDSGIFSLNLENLGNTSVLVSVECTNQWFDYYLAPNTGVTLPSVFLEWTNQNRTYPENTCIFQDWGPGYQDVVIYSMEADWDYVVSFPGCYVRSGADLPVVEHSVNCPEETTGLFPVILENKGDVWLYVDVTCWNDLYWFYLAPNSSASLPAVFVDLANQQKTYPNDTCVFYLNDEGHQEVEVYSEESDWDYSFKALTCNYSVGAETPQLIYTFDCPESDTDVSSVYVQNNGTVWLYIEMWCWNSDYAFYLPPNANVSLPVMFREWINPAETYPNGTCVMTDSADRTQFIGVYGAESDLDHMYDYLVCNRSVGESAPQISHSVNCSEGKAGNLAINLENTGDVWLYVEVGCWNDWFNFYLEPKSTAQLPAQFQDWANGDKTYPEDVCVLKEYDWHYQQVIVYSEESDWDFSYTYIGCDYSIGNDFPAISYNAQCPGDDGDFEISFENTGDTWLWVELDCLNGWQNVSLAPYSAQSVTASFDQWTNPEQFYSGTCLLEAVASHYQELRITPWESDWDNSTHYVVCDFSVGSAAPKVNHNVDCAVNDSGVFTLNLVNTGDVWLYTELRCWNGLMTVYLPPRSTHQILAAYNEWTNQELNYASDICLFEDWGKTQEIEIYNEEEDFDNSYTYATCAYSVGDDVLRDDHSTDCRTDNQDGFSVTLSNPGDVWLYVYLGCSNDAFHFFLEPRSSQTVPAALNTHQDLATDTCVFFEKDETAYAYTYTEEPDWDYTERQLWCRRGMNIRRTHWTKDAFKMLHSSSK